MKLSDLRPCAKSCGTIALRLGGAVVLATAYVAVATVLVCAEAGQSIAEARRREPTRGR
jgi:hypothetical protein